MLVMSTLKMPGRVYDRVFEKFDNHQQWPQGFIKEYYKQLSNTMNGSWGL